MTATRKKRALVAEDDEDIKALLVSCLELTGDFEVFACENGEGIVEKALVFEPDIISLDVMMPVVGGLEALASLRKTEQFADIPIILMTAKAMKAEVQDFADLKVTAVVTKPFDVMELGDLFHNILDQHSSNQMIWS